MKKLLLFGYIIIASVILLNACLDEKDGVSVSTHPESWAEEDAPDFHGNAILSKSLSLKNCQSCHGENYLGGSAKTSCFSSECHAVFPHPDGFADMNSANFHEGFIAENLQWDILACQKCHGADYAGDGFEQKNCLTCHTSTDGPEACNTCHGSAENYAAALDLQKNSATNALGGGAHQPHLSDTTWTTNIFGQCGTCHLEPENYSDPGHVDNSPHAELTFSDLATFQGKVNPIWRREDGSCSDAYCHGGFEFRRDESAAAWGYLDSLITGNNPTMLWQSVGTGQAECGTCHDLPPKGHIPQATCEGCHGRVVDVNFNIIDKRLHINGEVELF